MNKIDTEIERAQENGLADTGFASEVLKTFWKKNYPDAYEDWQRVENGEFSFLDEGPDDFQHLGPHLSKLLHEWLQIEGRFVDDLVDVYSAKGYLRGLKVAKRIIEAEEKKEKSN